MSSTIERLLKKGRWNFLSIKSSVIWRKFRQLLPMLWGICKGMLFRHTKFQRDINPSKLPPSETSAYFHSLRVHFHVLEWETLDQFCDDATKWGWNYSENHTPIQIDNGCAPLEILNFIRYKCKTGCVTNLCSWDCENGDVLS